MTLFITSSPYIDGADRAIIDPRNGFLDCLRQVMPPHPRALFIAAYPQERNQTCCWGADTAYAFSQAGMPFLSFHILDGYNLDEAAQLVSQSDLIFLSGGHVPTQNVFFQQMGLRELLADFNGVIMGISAGSMNAADVVYVQPEEPGESVPEFSRYALGLGLTQVNILPHYQKVKNNFLDGKRLYEDITYADSMGREFFVLPDGSYIYQDEEHLLLCGEGYRIKDGILEMLTRENETLDLTTIG